MPEPVPKEEQSGAWPPMTPERWRVVDVILQSALECEPDRRGDFVRDACGEDDALRREVESLLAAHEGMAETEGRHGELVRDMNVGVLPEPGLAAVERGFHPIRARESRSDCARRSGRWA